LAEESSGELAYRCLECNRRTGSEQPVWRCQCGALLDLEPPADFDRGKVDESEPGLWRYRAALPRPAFGHALRLGEVITPLVETRLGGQSIHLKLDYLLPTGSHKDRGAAVLLSQLRALDHGQDSGARPVVVVLTGAGLKAGTLIAELQAERAGRSSRSASQVAP
jgi:threonine synthase